MASERASTPAKRNTVGWWIELKASRSESTPQRTRRQAPMEAVRYILMPITDSSSMQAMVPRMRTIANFSLEADSLLAVSFFWMLSVKVELSMSGMSR